LLERFPRSETYRKLERLEPFDALKKIIKNGSR